MVNKSKPGTVDSAIIAINSILNGFDPEQQNAIVETVVEDRATVRIKKVKKLQEELTVAENALVGFTSKNPVITNRVRNKIQ